MQDHQQDYQTVALPPMPLLADEARIAAARDFAPDCRVPGIQRLALDGYPSFL